METVMAIILLGMACIIPPVGNYVADRYNDACDTLGGEWKPEVPECVVERKPK